MGGPLLKPLLLLLVLVGAPASAEVMGLLDQPQTFPWSVGLTPVVQEESGGLSKGSWRVKTSVLWFNTYRQYGLGESMVQQVDMEGLLPVVSAAWSPAPGWELRGQVQGWVLGGGVMDVFLAGFHGTLFLPNQGRDEVADGGYRDYVQGIFDQRSAGVGLTQTSFGVRAFDGAWSWSAWVKPPLPAPVDWGWTDRWTAGSGAGWGSDLFWAGLLWSGGLSAAVILADAEPNFPNTKEGLIYQGGAYGTVTAPWGPRALVQATWTKVPRTGEGYLDQGAGLLTSGFQFPFGKPWTLELALTEEFLTWATMEVGFQVGLTWNP